METKLYKRNAQGKPIQWTITQELNGHILVEYGVIGGKLHSEDIKPTQKSIDSEIQSMINAKRKEGYKSLQDLYDNAPQIIANNTDLVNYLNIHLPRFNTHNDGKFIPMLCKTLEDNKPFEKHTYRGQWKINGERCIITAGKSNDLFANVKLYYRSREGVDWTDKLSYLDEFLLPRIEGDILDMMVEEGVGLDGELYIPGYNINDINHFIKNNDVPQHFQLQYWCYDLCIENMIAIHRQDLLALNLGKYKTNITTKEEHLNNKERFLLLHNYGVWNIQDATLLRDRFIDLGFEGLIIRDEDAEYQFGGKRNSAMLKYKRKEDGWFNIIDIKEDKRGLPIFTLKNDINDECFDATYNATHDEQRYCIARKDDIIAHGKALVEYRERSGIKEVPFHSKIVKIKENES